jgi:hypothetical protein
MERATLLLRTDVTSPQNIAGSGPPAPADPASPTDAAAVNIR